MAALVVTTLFGFSLVSATGPTHSLPFATAFTQTAATSDERSTTGIPSTLNVDASSYSNAQNGALATANTAAGTGKKYIVFRDDDVFGDVNVLKAINQVHITENVPVTLGIIPHPSTRSAGNELGINPPYSYFKSIATNPLFEFAQHGYSHTNYCQPDKSAPFGGAVRGVPPNMIAGERPYTDESAHPRSVGATNAEYSEFCGRPYSDQYNAIKQGRDDFTRAFGVTPTTFLPPWNCGDNNTLKALHALGFQLYCTSQEDFKVREARINGIMVQGVDFYIGWDNYTNWQTGMSDLTQQTDAALNAAPSGDHFVVQYHYWAFEKSSNVLDPARLALLTQYIEHLKSRGDVEFTTLAGQKLGEPTQLSLSLNNTNPAAAKPISFSGSLQTNEISPVRLATVPVYLFSSTDNSHWSAVNASSTDASGLNTRSQSFSAGSY
ncbi:MAG: DUF2334 domain-containing protein [Halobacteriota archaeon]